ncbi:MAG: M48 family metalloprotease, partial [Desulfobacteraceae bacterium]|nr:M48 family metalloprotease [Desulfobacteraceae bacterium]
MFSNFLYFLIALVIYITSDFFDQNEGLPDHAILASSILTLVFIMLCHLIFARLKKRKHFSLAKVDHLAGLYTTRFSILALVLFAVNLYTFRLNLLFSGIFIFDKIPTFEAILFLGLFLFYLVVIWNAAYNLQKSVFTDTVSKKDFLLSNVSFSLPALIPWFFLSLSADFIHLLPIKSLKTIISSPAGEIGYVALFLVVIAIFGPVLIKALWKCTPLEKGDHRHRIEAVCQKAKLDYADILKWKLFGGNMITAGVMGLVGRFRYILVTPALMASLKAEEIEAVILHEIGHVQKNHMLFYLGFFAGFIACTYLLLDPLIWLLYLAEPIFWIFTNLGIDKSSAYPIVSSMTLLAFFVLYFRFVFGYFMRNFE